MRTYTLLNSINNVAVKKEISKYDLLANEFCEKHNITIDCTYSKTRKYFTDDVEVRDVYTISISKNENDRVRTMKSFEFGNSINNSAIPSNLAKIEQNIKSVRPFNLCGFDFKPTNYAYTYASTESLITFIRKHGKPSNYSILCALPKYEIGSLSDFCDNYGYTTDSIKANKIYTDMQELYYGFKNLIGTEAFNEFSESEIE